MDFATAYPFLPMKIFKQLTIAMVFFCGPMLNANTSGDFVTVERLYPHLDAILQQSLQQSPQMINRALNLEMAENDRIVARSGLLPSLGASYRHYQARDDRGDLTQGRLSVEKIYYDVTLTQPLFHWGERMNNAKIGNIQELITKGQYRDGYRLFAQEVRNLYQLLVVQKLSTKRAAFYLQYANTLRKQGEERLLKNVISGQEIFNLRLAAEQAQIALERTEYGYENSKQSFIRLTGISEITDEMIPDLVPAVAYDSAVYDRLLADFLGQNEPPTMEAYIARQQLAIQKLNYASAKTRLRPKINVVLGVTQDEQSYTENSAAKYQVNSLFGGISVNWSIFDGFVSRASVKNILYRKKQMENDYRQLTSRLASQAQNQVKQINFAARSMSIYDRYLVSAESNVKSKREEFKRGVISESDVDLAQIGLYDSQLNACNGRIEYLNRVADLLGTVMVDPVLKNIADQ